MTSITADPSKLDAPKLSESYNNPLISDMLVEVGTGAAERTIYVHKIILLHANHFLRSCAVGEWKEAEEVIIRFPHEEYEVINMWLGQYYGIGLPKPAADNPTTMAKLVKLFLFADGATLKLKRRFLNVYIQFTNEPLRTEPKHWMAMGLVAAIDVVFNDTNAATSMQALRTFFVRGILPWVCYLNAYPEYMAIYHARPRLGSMLLAQNIEYADADQVEEACEHCGVCAKIRN